MNYSYPYVQLAKCRFLSKCTDVNISDDSAKHKIYYYRVKTWNRAMTNNMYVPYF